MSRFEKLSQENNKPKAEASEEIFMTKSEIEALREEAEQIERELEEDPFIDSMDPPKELYNRIVQELKDKGIYHEDEEDVNEEKEEVVEEKKTKVVFYSRWKKIGKLVAMICLSMIGVFGVAMTSEANRVYLMNQVESWLGTDSNLKINNSRDRQEENLDEYEAKQDIENTLKLKVPKLLYIPQGMQFISYEVNEDSQMAYQQYSYNDKLITLYMSSNQKESTEFSSFDGVKLNPTKIQSVDVDAEVWEIKDTNDLEPCYFAKWVYKNCYYEISGKIEQETFLKIIEKIIF